MSMESDELRTLEDIWAALEEAVEDQDADEADAIINRAVYLGFPVGELRAYVEKEQSDAE